MAIEIRELLIRATVTRNLSKKDDYITKSDLRIERRRILDECVERLRDELENYRSGR